MWTRKQWVNQDQQICKVLSNFSGPPGEKDSNNVELLKEREHYYEFSLNLLKVITERERFTI